MIHPNKNKIKIQNKQIFLRIEDEYDIDNGSSPYLLEMDRCIEIIDEIEADKKGTNDE